jgi:hypothetical protein
VDPGLEKERERENILYLFFISYLLFFISSFSLYLLPLINLTVVDRDHRGLDRQAACRTNARCKRKELIFPFLCLLFLLSFLGLARWRVAHTLSLILSYLWAHQNKKKEE